MTRQLAAFFAIVILVTLLMGGSESARADEKRIALVIANAHYGPDIGELPNPVSDGRLIAESLQSVGFAVTLVTDADQKAMKRAIGNFGEALQAAGAEGIGLFYYAGHGIQVGGTNYLVPIGADLKREADADLEAIEAESVLKQMEFAGSRINVVILDACRNNPLARSVRSATRGLARMDAPTGSFIAYSTAPGEVAADGAGSNSPFATALAQEMAAPGQPIEETFRHVRVSVKKATDDQQVPWDSSSLTDAFVFNAKADPVPVVQAEATPQQTGTTQTATRDGNAEARRYDYDGAAMMRLPREIRLTKEVIETLRSQPAFQTLPMPGEFAAELSQTFVDSDRRETILFKTENVADGLSRNTRNTTAQDVWEGVAGAYKSQIEETSVSVGPLMLGQLGNGQEEMPGKTSPIYFEGRVSSMNSVQGSLFPIGEGTHLDLKYAWHIVSGEELWILLSASTIATMPCSDAYPELTGTCYVVETRSQYQGGADTAFWTSLYIEDTAVFVPWGEFGVNNVVQGQTSITQLQH